MKPPFLGADPLKVKAHAQYYSDDAKHREVGVQQCYLVNGNDDTSYGG